MSARTPTIETQRWGLFTEGERRADVDQLRKRFHWDAAYKFDCVYWRRGGYANWKWSRADASPTIESAINAIERMGYPAVPGRIADGPPRKFAVDGWDDIRIRRTHKD